MITSFLALILSVTDGDAFVAVNGVNVADTMIKEGLARAYTGGTRASWCP